MTKEEEFGFNEDDQIYIDKIKYMINIAINKCDKFVIVDRSDPHLYSWIKGNFIKIYVYFMDDVFKLSRFMNSGDNKFLIEWS